MNLSGDVKIGKLQRSIALDESVIIVMARIHSKDDASKSQYISKDQGLCPMSNDTFSKAMNLEPLHISGNNHGMCIPHRRKECQLFLDRQRV